MKIQGPVEVEVKVKIINEADDVQGEATIGLGRGIYPTEEVIRERVRKFAEQEMPDGYRLMTKQEYWDALCAENFGAAGYAMPGGQSYDA